MLQEQLTKLAVLYADSPMPETFVHLSVAVELKRQDLLRRLNQPPSATADLVAMRVDLLKVLRDLEQFVTLSLVPTLNTGLKTVEADGMLQDPVARFYLGNGGQVHMLHANADMSANDHKQSSAAMVNYLYDLDLTERNHENFAIMKTAIALKQAQNFANISLTMKRKETAR